MLDVKSAISMLEKRFPDKRIDGTPGEMGNLFVFSFVDKNASEDETRWDSTVVAVDKFTGEISWHSLFDEDIMRDAKPITNY